MSVSSRYFYKVQLNSRCIKSLPQLDLVSRPRSNHNDGHVGLLRGFDCLRETGLVIAPPLTPLRVVDLSIVADGVSDTIQRGDAVPLTLIDNIVTILANNM